MSVQEFNRTTPVVAPTIGNTTTPTSDSGSSTPDEESDTIIRSSTPSIGHHHHGHTMQLNDFLRRLLLERSLLDQKPPEQKEEQCRYILTQAVSALIESNDYTFLKAHQISVEYLTERNGFTCRIGKERNKNPATKLKYPDVFPLDTTIVAEGNNFVNANFITLGEDKMIASEAPEPKYFYNFWKMVWNHASVIVNLTELIELDPRTKRTVIKAHQYWPDEFGDFEDVSATKDPSPPPLRIKLDTIEYLSPDQNFDLEQYNLEKRQYITEYTFTLTNGDQEKKVKLLHYRYLKDMQAPSTVEEIASYNMLMQRIIDLEALYQENTTIAHCSAGIGRTGMLIGSLHHRKEHLRGVRTENAEQAAAVTLLKMRAQRPCMVQKPGQFDTIVWSIRQ